MFQEEILGQIVKYKLPETLIGSPSWHRTQLNDLMAMVDTYGLPRFFLTLICDERSELRWEDVDDL